MNHKIHRKKGIERLGLSAKAATVIVTILFSCLVFVSCLTINSHLNQPATDQTADFTSAPKAAIVDQLSLTYPNQTFIQTTENTLEQAGYSVDYFPGEEVTVEFYRNLPTHNYAVVILRVHSSAAAFEGDGFVETPVSLFTSENYSRDKYVWEQMTDQLMIASYTAPQPPYYFGITPKFVTASLNGKFQSSIVVMMGCEGLNNTKMAEAFVERGAEVYISWSESVLASQTDQATILLFQHLLVEKQTIKQAVTGTNREVGPDPAYNSLLMFYPLEAGDCAVERVAGDFVLGATGTNVTRSKR